MGILPIRRPEPRRWRLLPLAVVAAVTIACADRDATAPASSVWLELASDTVGSDGIIVRDEVWVDRTVEEEPWVEETPAESDTAATVSSEPVVGTASTIEAAVHAPEPVIRVGVIFVDLNASTIRFGGRDNSDPYELRRGSRTGPVIASGLTGETIAIRTGTTSATRRIQLTLPNGATVTLNEPAVAISSSGLVRLRRFLSDGRLYRGAAEVRFNAARSALIGVNELPIEQYIYGVVPRELPPNPWYQAEAQKAQAVAARTYARRRMQFCPVSRCSNGYHIVPTTSDQVYDGFTGERAISSAAVDATRGLVATSNGRLIEALYSSTSGGWTANSEHVFANALSYLRGVPDAERGQAMDHVPRQDVFQRHANPTNLRNHANGDFEADWSIFHRWYVYWSKEEMRLVAGRVQTSSFIEPGEVYSVEVVSRSPTGHAFEVRFVTEKRDTLVARKDLIRSALRYVTYTSAGMPVLNSLRSILVFIQPVVDPRTKETIGWEAWGGGYGHGVGLSQTGAAGMAERKYSFEEILGHYYRGVSLETWW